MKPVQHLESLIREKTGRRYVRLVGRGATAEYVALRAATRIVGTGEVILPDLICSTVLDGALLAGYRPVFGDVHSSRFILTPDLAREKQTLQTRVILYAHVFGLHATPPARPTNSLIIEDAVQGLGGPVGRDGDLSFISFDPTKMIDGRGGAVLTDDLALWEAVQSVSLNEQSTRAADEPAVYRTYRPQLETMRADLLRPFDDSLENIARIEAGWASLSENARRRNENAHFLAEALRGFPLTFPDLSSADVIWRFPLAAPTTAAANAIARHLQFAGLPGSRLYMPLSALFNPDPTLFSGTLARRLINLWVDASVTQGILQKMVEAVEQGFTLARGRMDT